MAFGDSITEGVLEPACPGGLTSPASYLADTRILLASVNVPHSYPSVLQNLLASRYSAQSPVVTNEGQAGERASDSATLRRLRDVLNRTTPETLLLQEGVNDINSNDPAVIGRVTDALGTLVREARGRGIDVLLGTLLPERAGACRGYAPTLIAPANEQIRAMATREGAVLVDLYQAFSGREGTLLGNDGLHPNAAGYEQMAQTFVDAILTRFESASTPSGFR